MTSKPSIVCEHVFRSFTSGKTSQLVLSDVSLSVVPGELTMIMGPSGSGKSTLLAILSGLLSPDTGNVTVLGRELTKLSPVELDRFRLDHCGFVFQGFNLFPALTAFGNVLLALQYGMKIMPAEAESRVTAALEAVGLSPRAHLRPMELSGGEKQRVAIARALVKRPSFLFADEPTSSLDSHNGKIVIDILHHVAREQGTTIVCVSHDDRLLKHADRVVTLEDGQVTSDTKTPNILEIT